MGRGQRRANNAAVLMIALIATALQDGVVATEYNVGNTTNWDFAPTSSFYNDWSASLKFYPGDKLVFKYLPIAHNVLDVNETDYNTCNQFNPIAIHQTGNDVVNLTMPGTRYFTCGFLGHCEEGGMRMKVTTVAPPPATTPLIPSLPALPPLLPSPMTSPNATPTTPATPVTPVTPVTPLPHVPHGHAHPPATAPISVPGHSAAPLPSLLLGLFISLSVAAGSLAFLTILASVSTG